jgi:hypothetical protein
LNTRFDRFGGWRLETIAASVARRPSRHFAIAVERPTGAADSCRCFVRGSSTAGISRDAYFSSESAATLAGSPQPGAVGSRHDTPTICREDSE